MFTKIGKYIVRQNLPSPTYWFSRYQEWSGLRRILLDLKINCVLDVGANAGQYARSLRDIGYKGAIVSFEPLSQPFRQLSETFAKDKLWQGFNFAIGRNNGTATINLALDCDMMSSLRSPKGGWNLAHEEVEVRTIDSLLPSILANLNIPHPRLFLKTDTQGYDVEVVKGATQSLHYVYGLQSELSVLPLYENTPHYTEALQFYESLGFSLVGLHPIAWVDNQIQEFNCIMQRTKKSNDTPSGHYS